MENLSEQRNNSSSYLPPREAGMTLGDVNKQGSAALEADLKGRVFVVSVKVAKYEGEDRNNVHKMRALQDDDEIPRNIAEVMDIPF